MSFTGAAPYFVQFLDVYKIQQYCHVKTPGESTNPSKMNISKSQLYALQLEAAWCITNIVSGTSEHAKTIIQLGCVPYLINLLSCEDLSHVVDD